MPVEQDEFNFNTPEQHEIPISYVVDGVFLTPSLSILVRRVPDAEEFSPGTVDLPSTLIPGVLSPNRMRHAALTVVRAHGIFPTSCEEWPFSFDRTIARNNGGYRETRRIFYKGRIPEDIALPDGFRFATLEETKNIPTEVWRRKAIPDAIQWARNLADKPPVPGRMIGTSNTEGVIDPLVNAQTQKIRWNLSNQLNEAEILEELKIQAVHTRR